MKLRTTLRKMLAGWKNDLATPWQELCADVELNLDSPTLNCEMRPGELIVPQRKQCPFPGAPQHAHVFHAYDGIKFADIRAVIIGQDPYPNPAWATGRAFEQGNLTKWPENGYLVADSLRRVVQVLASARTGKSAYAVHDRAWKDLIKDVRSGLLRLERPRELFDRLESEGVLFLNTSLTVSAVIREGEPKQPRTHFRLWESLII